MELKVGDQVSIDSPLPYLKTAEPMPMLRPPDLVSLDELGELVGLKPQGVGAVRFRRGTFLIPLDRLVLRLNAEDE